MFTADFNYTYPESLVAQVPRDDFRILFMGAKKGATADKSEPVELTRPQLLQQFRPGDILVINDTKVLQRRVIAPNGLEILFLQKVSTENSHENAYQNAYQWEVLFPASEIKTGASFALPGLSHGEPITAKLISRGLPQVIEVSLELDVAYFEEHAVLALPPYIQKARGERRNRPEDMGWYQTKWAKQPGSLAAPTASLHFSMDDLDYLSSCGVIIAPLTLHVGLGTFLPIKTARLDEHVMHKEFTYLPTATVNAILQAKQKAAELPLLPQRNRGSSEELPPRVWALGTTVTRALESWASGRLQETVDGFIGETDLFIRPGYKFEVVDGLLTNFHQPGSTLLALVSAFAGHDRVMSAYKWAVQNNFRLFSYGDLSVWMRQ